MTTARTYDAMPDGKRLVGVVRLKPDTTYDLTFSPIPSRIPIPNP